MPGGIYQIAHIETGKAYVGSAVSLRKRWNRHLQLLRLGRHDNVHLQRAWNQCGAEAFRFSVLEYVHEPSDLIEREKHWFDCLKVLETGYNLLPVAGSRLGFKHSEETKRKIRDAHIGKVVSQETREKMGAASRGRPLSPEARAKLSAIAKARVPSPESNAKRAAAMRGRKFPPEAAAKRLATIARQKQALRQECFNATNH